MSKSLLAYTLGFVTILIWSSTFVITKVMLENVTPIQLLTARYIIVVFFLLIIYPKFQKIVWKNEVLYILSGLFLALYFIFENNALGQTFASNVSLIIATIPLQTQIVKSIIHQKSFFTKTGIIGIIVSYIGVAVIVLSGSGVEGIKIVGDLLAFFAAFSFAVYSIYLEKTSSSLHIIQKTRKIFIYGLIVFIVYLFIIGDYKSLPVLSSNLVLGFIYLGVVASGLAFIMWNHAVKLIGAIKTNILTYTVPVFTMIFSFIFIDEPITLIRILGGVIIIVGVYLSERNHVKE